MKIIRHKLVLLICIIIAPFIYADIPAEQTRGLYDAVLDGYKHLSPTHGFVASEQKTFDGYYHFTQPSEPLYKLMHILFRFIDNLIPHVSDSAVGTHLDAAMIGKLLAAIEKNLNRETSLITISKDELKKQLLEILNQTGTRMKQKTKVGPREDFAQMLVDALDETGHWDPNGKHYPQFLVHDMLLTLLFKRVNSKSEYKNYFDQFTALNDGKGILKPNATELLNKSYEDPSDPSTMAKNILAAQPSGEAYTMFDYVLSHYDSLAFATVKLGAQQLGYPPQVTYSTVLLSWYQKNPVVIQENLNPYKLIITYGFSDCMETALRNLLIFTEYDQTNNSFKGNIKYFKEFDVETIQSEPARTAWANLVSDISQVKYNKRVKEEKKPEGSVLIMENAKNHNKGAPWIKPVDNDGWYYYELEPGLDTIVFVINRLYNLQLNNFGDFLKHFNLECPSQKVVNIEFLGVPVEQTICTITDQDKKNCILNYHPGHAYVDSYPRGSLSERMSSFVAEVFPIWTGSYFLPVLNLYQVNLPKIQLSEGLKKELVQSSLLRHALLTQQLSSNEVKQYILYFIIVKLPELKNIWYKSFTIQLVDQLLSLNDPQATALALKTMAENTFEWGTLPDFIKKFKENKHLLDEFAVLNILSTLINNTKTASNKKIVSDFVAEQFKEADANMQQNFLGFFKSNSDLYKIFFNLFLSENNIENPPPQLIPAMIIELLKEGKRVGITKEQTQNIMNKLMLHREQLSDIEIGNEIILELKELTENIDIEYLKEIILKLFSQIKNPHISANVIKQLRKNIGRWGQDFIDKLEAMSPK